MATNSFLVRRSVLLCALLLASPVGAQDIQRYDAKGGKDLLHEAVAIPAQGETLLLSGQGPSPIDPALSLFDVTAPEQLGDTRAQTRSTLLNIKRVLEKRGYRMSDLVKMTIYLTADPALSKMDSAGMNAAFREFFRTADNPNSVARTTVEVARLTVPHMLVEIEAVAAKGDH